METKKTNKKRYTKAELSEANKALKELNTPQKGIDDLNNALKSTNYSELADFVMRFAMTKDCELMFRLLSRLQEQPQTFRGKDEFNTLYDVAIIDGERQMVRKFANVVAKAINGDRLELERELVKNPYI